MPTIDVVVIHHHQEGPGILFQSQTIQQVRAGAQVFATHETDGFRLHPGCRR